MKLRFEVVENPEPNPVVDAWLDYLSELSKQADTVAIYIGKADPR